MIVGLLIYGTLTTVSGGYLYDRTVVEYLREQGDRVEIVSLPWRNYVSHLGDNLSNNLLERLTHLDVEVLVQDELNHPSLFYLNRLLRRQRHNYPLVSIVHHLRCSEEHPGWQKWFYSLIERQYLRRVDGFVFNSQTTQQAVEKLTVIKQPYVVATPAGNRLNIEIDEEEIIARTQRPGALALVFIGNLIPRKGLHTLIEAMAKLPRAAYHLTVVGSQEADPRYSNQVRNQVIRNGMEEQIEFRGVLEDAELVQVLRQSHVLVVPSSYEGYGIVYLEGMGFGLPAIATTGGAAGEIITDGRNGWLIRPGDTEALAACLQIMAQERTLLINMSLAARRRYLAQPGWENTGRRIRLFLGELVSNW